jgi:hypothetical protein
MTERMNVIERNVKQKHWKNMSIFVHIRYIIGENSNGRTLHERHVHNLNQTTYSAVCVCYQMLGKEGKSFCTLIAKQQHHHQKKKD